MARTDKIKGREETLRRKEIRKMKLKSVKTTTAVLVGASALTLGLVANVAPAQVPSSIGDHSTSAAHVVRLCRCDVGN